MSEEAFQLLLMTGILFATAALVVVLRVIRHLGALSDRSSPSTAETDVENKMTAPHRESNDRVDS